MRGAIILLVALLATAPASAAVKDSSPEGFTLVEETLIPLPHGKAWHRLLRVQDWWSGDHSYSGQAKNFSLEPEAGGCWCETWEGGSVEHGRVIALLPGKLLRLQAALGPLQRLPVTAILSFEVTSSEKGTKVIATYAVAGPPTLKLDAMAAPVDAVLREQVSRLGSLAP